MVAPAKLRVSWFLIGFSITHAYTCSTYYIWVESDLAELIRRLLVVVLCYQALNCSFLLWGNSESKIPRAICNHRTELVVRTSLLEIMVSLSLEYLYNEY